MILRTFVVGQLKTNCYLVGCEHTRLAMIIDPGGDAEKILDAIQESKVKVQHVVLTHFHFDHVMAADAVLAATNASLAIHHVEAAYLSDPPALFRYFTPSVPRGLVADLLLHDGDDLAVGQLNTKILHTPGHSPGSVSLWIAQEEGVFCGDVLFREGVGRADFPGCSREALERSIRERLFALPDETTVYPGHGPKTTIGHERRHNPWVGV